MGQYRRVGVVTRRECQCARLQNARQLDGSGGAILQRRAWLAYLLRTDSTASRTDCSEWLASSAVLVAAAVDAPLDTIASVSERFRFASDGDAGAGGSEGGVRVPLAAAMVMMGAVRDAGAMP